MEYIRTKEGYLVKKEKEENIIDVEMDKYQSDLMSNEWTVPSDEFLESIFSGDLLKDLDNSYLNINDFPENVDLNNDKLSTISSCDDKNFNGLQGMQFDDMDLTFPENTPLISSNSSDSGLSSDHLDIDTSPDYEPLSPALSSPGPSISERGGQNSPPRFSNQNSPAKYIKLEEVVDQPKVIVEKVNSIDGNLLFNNPNEITGQLLPKQVKVFRMPVQNGTINDTNHALGKKVTIQLKNTTKPVNKNTVIINKQSIPTVNSSSLTGVKKIIRVQNPSNPRSILLPVSIQDVKDFRTIKIISASNIKSKTSSNVKLAAANLLQQSKQGLVQKNVLISQDQLMATEDCMSDHTSDGENYVFEEVMQQSSTVIKAAEKQTNVKIEEFDEIDQDLENDEVSVADEVTNDQDSGCLNVGYPKLILTAEEKRLLAKEGITLPSNYPLTKHEERELKRIRRKIRNKISAQDSRKRKKEYVDGLEERVKQCTEENQTLLKRIKLLQTQNHNLMGQMKKLQSLLTKGTNKTAQPATCLMVLLLSMILVAVPNIKLGQNTKETELMDALQNSIMNSQPKSRSLLYDSKEQLGDALTDEEINFDDLMSYTGLNDQEFNDSGDDVQSNPLLKFSSTSSNKKFKSLVDYDVDDTIYSSKKIDDNNLFNEQAKIFQENHKSLQSSGFNIEGDTNKIIDPDLMDLINKRSDGSFELNIDQIASLSKKAADLNRIIISSDDEIIVGNNQPNTNNLNNIKKNSSAQIKTRNLITQNV